MKILLLGLLALSSLSAFAQMYGGSTYYGYGSIPMSDASYGANRQEPQHLKPVHYPFVKGTEVKNHGDFVCISGEVEYGNNTTTKYNYYKLDFLKCPRGVEREVFDLTVYAGSLWYLEKGEDPKNNLNYWTMINGVKTNEYIQKNVQAERCVEIEQIRKAMKKSKCNSNRVSINNVEINLE